MTFRERLGAANRLQQSRRFKIVATALIALLGLGAFASYFVVTTSPVGLTADQRVSDDMVLSDSEEISDQERAEAERFRSAIAASEDAIDRVLKAQSNWAGVGLGILYTCAGAIVVVWLGLGLTYLALLTMAALVGIPLALFESTKVFGYLIFGLAGLTFSFTALLQLARVLLGQAGPVCAIAKVVLDEAVRMKISLVFIVILLVGLSALPNALDPAQPLRYRVQSFMSFSTGLSFWTIGALTLLFGAATVTFEQRDKIIWQTVTKPVSAWKYVLGKWLGVCALNAVLLTVCATGIFGFIEYLRDQPALGEREAFVAIDGGDTNITEDRWILETQILSSRVTVENEPPFAKDDEAFQEAARERLLAQQETDPDFAATPGLQQTFIDDLYTASVTAYRSVEPAQAERYWFRGLTEARDRGELLLFRYRIDAGTNRPDEFYDVSFEFSDGSRLIQRMGLGFWHSTTVYPTAVIQVTDADRARFADDPERLAEMEKADGVLEVIVTNGNIAEMIPNADTLTFPPGGLEFSYSVGSYRSNFFRAMIVLWAKLAFLAMVAIWASTFLSFPVACLVAFGVFLAAEGAGFLQDSIETFATTERDGSVKVFSLVASVVTRVVAGAFSLYADLRPTRRLVMGEQIPVASVVVGGAFIMVVSSLLYLSAVVTMKRRELAMYSGR